MSDGLLGKCKKCAKKDTRNNYRNNKDHYVAYDAKRFKTPHRKEQRLRYQQKHRKKYPEKYRARKAVARAIKNGQLKPKPCHYCGEVDVQAHHADYTKPLVVTWVCFKCHREKEHGQKSTTKRRDLPTVVSLPVCPAGGRFGKDTDNLPECKDCIQWDQCDDAKHK